MKFLPESKKKKNWSVAILIIAVAGIIYVNFFASAPKPQGTSPRPDSKVVQNKPSEEGSQSSVSPDSSKLLPFGKSIDDSVLSDSRFLKLKPTPGLEVTPEELGQNNLFGQ